MLQVTPNGSWGRDHHPDLPLTTTEVLADVRESLVAGATGVHLHVRDADGAETLDPAAVRDLCGQVRALGRELGVDVEVGLTTGAWILPDLGERIARIREWEEVDCATVNLGEPGFERVMAALLDVGIGIDVGLWTPAEVPVLAASGFVHEAQRISIELSGGEPHFLSGPPEEASRRVNEALDDLGVTCPRLTHGEDEWTWPLVEDAFRRGHDTRVGFEDSVLLPDGSRASSNADLVRAAVAVRERMR